MKKKGMFDPPTLSYIIKVKGPGRSKSATVEAPGDQTLAQLDRLIREEMDYERSTTVARFSVERRGARKLSPRSILMEVERTRNFGSGNWT
jgi:hypothetical protein